MRIEIRTGKPTDEVIMTDGAAAIGWGAALGIKEALGLNYLPGILFYFPWSSWTC
jgi:hypothetical protein